MTDNPTIHQVELDMAELESGLLDKGITAEAWLSVKTGRDYITFFHNSMLKCFDGDYSIHFHGGYSETLASAKAYIASLPSPEDAVIVEYQRKVADAIDYGTENALDEKLISPLRRVSKAIHENLLIHEASK